MNVCPACSTENLDGETVCHQCGGALNPPPMVDCVVCAAPVKVGAKFCKRCGSAQPDVKVAATSGAARAPAGRQAHAEDDADNEKTVIMSPQAREAFMAQHAARTHAPAPAPIPAPAPAPAPAPVFAAPPTPAEAPAPTPRAAEINDAPPLRTMRDLPRTKPPAPKRSWLPIALGAGAFVVAALVSTLLVMSGSSDEPVTAPLSDIGAYPAPDNTAPTETAPAALAPAVVAEPTSAPAFEAETSTPAEVPVVVAPPVTAPAVAPAAAPAPATLATPATPPQNAVTTTRPAPRAESGDAAAAPKPKSKPKQDSAAAAAKRKQAEDALNRLLNQ